MTNIDKEYLIGHIGSIIVGFSSQDVSGVFNNDVKIHPLVHQSDIYLGICQIHKKTMQVIDLRKRLRLRSAQQDHLTSQHIVTFETGLSIALVVDIIDGLKRIETESIERFTGTIGHDMNIDLLFPNIGKLADGKIVHLMDATYLDKIDPISNDDSGELELF